MVKINRSPTWQFSNELQGIILIGFSLMIFKLMVKGTITSLVAPKLIPFLLITMSVLFILGFFRLLNSNLRGADCDCEVCDENTSFLKIIFTYIIFLSPLFYFFTIQDYSIKEDILSYNGFSSSKDSLSSEGENVSTEHKIEVTDANFFQIMDMLNANLDSIEGTEIVMKGFIYRDSTLDEQEAVIARYVMTHCIIDLSVYGYLLDGDLQHIESNNWYQITGVVVKKDQDGETMPSIQIKSMEEVEPPKEEYIYWF